MYDRPCGLKLWLIIAMVAVFMAAIVYGDAQAGSSPASTALEIAAAIVGLALLPLLFTRPMPVALALTVLAAVAATGTPVANIATLHIERTRPLKV
ncbi:MAG: hypothetical protein M3422_07210, partial [Actinomycetota bacterium]|nr:hypothetical protein [Actinomycetota bacterium]